MNSVSDAVDYWITFNEPHVFCLLTYCAGAWPGGNPDMLEAATSALPTGVFHQVMNWMAIAHSKAYDYIHEKRFPPVPMVLYVAISTENKIIVMTKFYYKLKPLLCEKKYVHMYICNFVQT